MINCDNDNVHIDNEVLRTLGTLDNLEDIKTGPFFYAKLRAKIDNTETVPQSMFNRGVLGNRVVPALLLLVIALNVFTIQMVLRSNSTIKLNAEFPETGAEEYLLAGAADDLDIIFE